MKVIQYIYKDFPLWNCTRILTPEEYETEMQLNRKYHNDITEAENKTIIKLHRYNERT